MIGYVGDTCLGCGVVQFDIKPEEAKRGMVDILCGRCGSLHRGWLDDAGKQHIAMIAGPTVEPNDDHDGTPLNVQISDFALYLQSNIDCMYDSIQSDPEAVAELTRRLRRVRIGLAGAKERVEMDRPVTSLQLFMLTLSTAAQERGLIIRRHGDYWMVTRPDATPADDSAGCSSSLHGAIMGLINSEAGRAPYEPVEPVATPRIRRMDNGDEIVVFDTESRPGDRVDIPPPDPQYSGITFDVIDSMWRARNAKGYAVAQTLPDAAARLLELTGPVEPSSVYNWSPSARLIERELVERAIMAIDSYRSLVTGTSAATPQGAAMQTLIRDLYGVFDAVVGEEHHHA